MRSSLEIEPNQTIVGCVANLVPIKGHKILLQAISLLKDVHVVLAGGDRQDKYAEELRQECERLDISNRVHFLGSVKDIPSLLAGLDIFVLPTLQPGEGCPVALLEAMAASRACVASDVRGAMTSLRTARVDYSFHPATQAALSLALQKLCKSPESRPRLGGAASERIAGHYTVEKEVAAYQKMYADIAKTKGFANRG